jgi:hypothetical protein
MRRGLLHDFERRVKLRAVLGLGLQHHDPVAETTAEPAARAQADDAVALKLERGAAAGTPDEPGKHRLESRDGRRIHVATR